MRQLGEREARGGGQDIWVCLGGGLSHPRVTKHTTTFREHTAHNREQRAQNTEEAILRAPSTYTCAGHPCIPPPHTPVLGTPATPLHNHLLRAVPGSTKQTPISLCASPKYLPQCACLPPCACPRVPACPHVPVCPHVHAPKCLPPQPPCDRQAPLTPPKP